MKKLFFILLVTVLASCDNVNVAPGPGPLVTTKDNNSYSENKPFSNPTVFMGSDFGNFFQTMYKLGDFDGMIEFTSSQSINQFGKEAILEFYKNELDFGYDIGKRPLSHNVSGDIITLNYESKIMATKKIVRVNVIVENDSCKIVLPDNLKNFPS